MPIRRHEAPALTIDRLRAVLFYDPATGLFTWLASLSPRWPVGSVAGSVTGEGYVRISIDGERFSAHRLAWFYFHERWPVDLIDHRNFIGVDNRIDNLREASHAESLRHRRSRRPKSGFKGVTFVRATSRWAASIDHDGVKRSLGRFGRAEDAYAAYCAAARRLHGEFACLE
jgi:hypothetical protein